jgi:chromosome segregation ATPase
LDSEEKEARTGAEAARAAAKADARTETSAILESVERDRAGLQAALTSAAARIRAAEKRADEAEAAVARKEAENREAAAGWVRSQAAEIEADAALASEMASTGTAPGSASGDTAALVEEVETLKAAVETERQEKVAAITAAEARLREIEAKARETEARLDDGSVTATDSPSPAETREAAVDWLRGQIAALKKEIESSSERSGD